jgi:hypothetical protein
LYPYLPENKVRAVILDGRTPKDIIKKFYNMNIEVLLTPQCKNVYEAIAYHPDIMLHLIDEKTVVVEPNIDEKFLYALEQYGLTISYGEKEIESNYPLDIAYNVARVGKFAIHNFKFSDQTLINSIRGVKCIDVKQGYSKCSICIVDDNSIITADKGIYKQCSLTGMDVLLIRPGDIVLPGMNIGFIGGCSGKISKNKIVFSGRIESHSSSKEIIEFLHKKNIEYINLSENILLDIGSIVPLI